MGLSLVKVVEAQKKETGAQALSDLGSVIYQQAGAAAYPYLASPKGKPNTIQPLPSA
jgi:hypothetical protein